MPLVVSKSTCSLSGESQERGPRCLFSNSSDLESFVIARLGDHQEPFLLHCYLPSMDWFSTKGWRRYVSYPPKLQIYTESSVPNCSNYPATQDFLAYTEHSTHTFSPEPVALRNEWRQRPSLLPSLPHLGCSWGPCRTVPSRTRPSVGWPCLWAA